MSDILLRQSGAIGHATLNRPKALNALTHQMLLDLETALISWADNDAIKLVLIDAQGERAFCAGGDIVDLYQEGIAGRDDAAKQFWRDEYRLNALIADYQKPYVALMDGIVMGGGVGVSAHGSHRIVTERTMFAMPECAIGLIPDVGGSLLLANMPGDSGVYAGLTGARLSGADCIFAGLADAFVPSEKLPALKDALIESGDPSVIARFAGQTGPSDLAAQQAEISAVFTADTVAEIEARLVAMDGDFAVQTLKNLRRGAPLARIAALKTIRAARADGTLQSALRNEYRFVSQSVLDGEFIEGIRAAVIEKTRDPNWKYPTLQSVPDALISSLDHPAAGGDLVLRS